MRFEAADNCFTDREMDVIDTGGNYESFQMRQVAQCLIAALRLTEEWALRCGATITRSMSEQTARAKAAQWSDSFTPVSRMVTDWQEESA